MTPRPGIRQSKKQEVTLDDDRSSCTDDGEIVESAQASLYCGYAWIYIGKHSVEMAVHRHAQRNELS